MECLRDVVRAFCGEASPAGLRCYSGSPGGSGAAASTSPARPGSSTRAGPQGSSRHSPAVFCLEEQEDKAGRRLPPDAAAARLEGGRHQEILPEEPSGTPAVRVVRDGVAADGTVVGGRLSIISTHSP